MRRSSRAQPFPTECRVRSRCRLERASFATGDRSRSISPRIDVRRHRPADDLEAARRASREIASRAAKSRRSRRGAITASVEKHGRCIGRPLSLYSSRALDQRTNTFTAEPRSDARTHTSSRSTSRPNSQPSDQPSSQSAQRPHNTRAIIRARRVRPRLNALENSAIWPFPSDRYDRGSERAAARNDGTRRRSRHATRVRPLVASRATRLFRDSVISMDGSKRARSGDRRSTADQRGTRGKTRGVGRGKVEGGRRERGEGRGGLAFEKIARIGCWTRRRGIDRALINRVDYSAGMHRLGPVLPFSSVSGKFRVNVAMESHEDALLPLPIPFSLSVRRTAAPFRDRSSFYVHRCKFANG